MTLLRHIEEREVVEYTQGWHVPTSSPVPAFIAEDRLPLDFIEIRTHLARFVKHDWVTASIRWDVRAKAPVDAHTGLVHCLPPCHMRIVCVGQLSLRCLFIYGPRVESLHTA